MVDSSKIRYVFGIDPGLNGGITRIDVTTGLVLVRSTPIIKGTSAKKGPRGGKIPAIKDECDPLGMAKLVPEQVYTIEPDPGPTISMWIERVGAMPGQGVTSMFRFGYATALWHGIFGARNIRPNLVAPQTWKSQFGLNDDKNASRSHASILAPSLAECWPLVKHDGRAESFLIACFGLAQLGLEIPEYRLDPGCLE